MNPTCATRTLQRAGGVPDTHLLCRMVCFGLTKSRNVNIDTDNTSSACVPRERGGNRHLGSTIRSFQRANNVCTQCNDCLTVRSLFLTSFPSHTLSQNLFLILGVEPYLKRVLSLLQVSCEDSPLNVLLCIQPISSARLG
jgi:hypothetical protein